MASDYRVAFNVWNSSLALLTKLSPQPASNGVKATDIQYLADGSLYRQGLYIELLYSAILGTVRYQVILSQFGLNTATSAQVTIYCPDDTFTYLRYNGIAVRPEVNRSNYMLRDVAILIRNLVAI